MADAIKKVEVDIPAGEAKAARRFGLIVIGDEILSGRRQDKHMSKLIELLNERGLSLSWAKYVADDPEQITATLKDSFASGDVVFSTGGIGATPDDHTRQCAALALGTKTELHPTARELIAGRIQSMAEGDPIKSDLNTPENQHRFKMGEFRSIPGARKNTSRDRPQLQRYCPAKLIKGAFDCSWVQSTIRPRQMTTS